MQSLPQIQTPPEIKDVIKRRFQNAPTSILRSTFGESKLAFHVWGDNHRFALGFGSNKFRAETEMRYRSFGDPFPGIERFDQQLFRVAMKVQGKADSVGKKTLSGRDAALVLDYDASILLYDVDIQTDHSAPYSIDFLFVGASRLPCNFTSIAERFEMVVVRFMAPNYTRDSNANKSS